MNLPEQLSIRVKNYKCFGEDEQGFDEIRPINVIIGRNNAGKSTLLELVNYVVDPSDRFQGLGHRGGLPHVSVTQPVEEPALRAVFSENTSGGGIPGRNHWEYGARWIGSSIKYKLQADGTQAFVALDPPFVHTSNVDRHQNQLASRVGNPLSGKVFKHMLAERDVAPEGATRELRLGRHGGGATNIIQYFINATTFPRESIEGELLGELNRIYEPDSHFDRILVQWIAEQNLWEVYLDEPGKGLVPLTHTGSGFKTILLVLLHLYLVPYIEDKDVGDYIFAFEELENNLHPALQRRLLSYLRDFAVEHGCIFFLTTHSNVVIDVFSRDGNAQIVHVTHDGERASARRVQTYVDNTGVLDDLDIRASDLLQANCVLWVEGPSDRLYLNRWIELWSDGALREGVHYQCMFYGGRLLAHISGDDPELVKKGISLMSLNRNAALVVDSDKARTSDNVSETKERVANEVGAMGGVVWITDGREIENYIAADVMRRYYGRAEVRRVRRFEDFAKYLDRVVADGEGKRFERAKVEFAARVCPMMAKDDLATARDLPQRLDELCSKIRAWNGLVGPG